MSAPVDVLAVMGRNVLVAKNRHMTARTFKGGDARLADLAEQQEARDAVAELVDRADAVAEMLEGMKELGVTIPNESRLAKLRAALARVQGGGQ